MYLRDRSAQTILHAATLRKKLQIKLSSTPSHSILTLGQPVPALTLQCQAPGRVTTGLPVFKSLVWLDPEKSRRKQDFNPASSAPKADALTESRLHQDFSGVESYQWRKNWHSSGYPARHLALWGHCWDWLNRCQYTVSGWDGKLDLQLLSQCGSMYNYLSISIPELHLHVAGTLTFSQRHTCGLVLGQLACSQRSTSMVVLYF